MILGFKTQHKGKPTFFPEKIIAGVDPNAIPFQPKLHTFRNGERWKAGNSIQMATGVRTTNYFQFNTHFPSLQTCKSVQSIHMIRVDDLPRKLMDDTVYIIDKYIAPLKETFTISYKVQIDNRFLKKEEIDQLAINDGFICADDMFDWFEYQDFHGQIIHWTDLKY